MANADLQKGLELLHTRISKRRKDQERLSDYSLCIIGLYDKCKSDILREAIDSSILTILEDCDVFFQMSTEMAMDAMLELSNWASFYYTDKDHTMYVRICEKISSVRASYPLYYK
jgi:hypothetical protein